MVLIGNINLLSIQIMECATSGEKDGSSGEEPSPKRYKGDPDAPKPGKSVVVLLDSDVTVGENGQVFMPNTIEMAKLKKKEKGQYVGKITFSSEMTKEDVLKQLHSNFPVLKDKRIQRYVYCIIAFRNS